MAFTLNQISPAGAAEIIGFDCGAPASPLSTSTSSDAYVADTEEVIAAPPVVSGHPSPTLTCTNVSRSQHHVVSIASIILEESSLFRLLPRRFHVQSHPSIPLNASLPAACAPLSCWPRPSSDVHPLFVRRV